MTKILMILALGASLLSAQPRKRKMVPSGTPTIADPTFSPAAGSYASTQSVTISTVTSATGLHICWTSDGSTPASVTPGTCSNGTTDTMPISVAASEVLKALATAPSYNNSGIVSGSYTITGGGGTPTFLAIGTGYTSSDTAPINIPVSVVTGSAASGGGTTVDIPTAADMVVGVAITNNGSSCWTSARTYGVSDGGTNTFTLVDAQVEGLFWGAPCIAVFVSQNMVAHAGATIIASEDGAADSDLSIAYLMFNNTTHTLPSHNKIDCGNQTGGVACTLTGLGNGANNDILWSFSAVDSSHLAALTPQGGYTSAGGTSYVNIAYQILTGSVTGATASASPSVSAGVTIIGGRIR